jgi:hypothetical protein
LGRRWIERQPASDLKPAAAPGELGIGIGIGLGLFSAVIGLLAMFGIYRVTGVSRVAFLLPLLHAGATSVSEEIVFRGFLFRLFARLANFWTATAVCSIFFGLAHFFNPGATWMSSLAIAIEAGILLSLAYAYTQRLWLPIGIHFAWNFAEGTIFGLSVSGSHAKPGFINGVLQGSTLFTGGAFGPEASVLAVVMCLIPSAVMLRLILKRSPAARGASV